MEKDWFDRHPYGDGGGTKALYDEIDRIKEVNRLLQEKVYLFNGLIKEVEESSIYYGDAPGIFDYMEKYKLSSNETLKGVE